MRWVRPRAKWPTIDRLYHRIGRRGAALLVFAEIDAVVGWSLLDPELRAQTAAVPVYRALVDMAPLALWGWLWLVVGAVCIWCAPARDDTWAYALAIGIKVVWAGGMLTSWIAFDAPRGPLLVVINGWPEPGADHVPRADEDDL